MTSRNTKLPSAPLLYTPVLSHTSSCHGTTAPRGPPSPHIHTPYSVPAHSRDCYAAAPGTAPAAGAAALSVSRMLSTFEHTAATCLSHCTSCSKLSSKKMSASTCGSVYV